jgi:hypothetical protein
MLGRTKPLSVRLVNDYYTKWPVWFDSILDDKEAAPLSQDLKQRLTEWSLFFNSHFDYPDGWDHSENRITYNTRGIQLAKQVANELGAGYRVSVLLDIPRKGFSSGWKTIKPNRCHR